MMVNNEIIIMDKDFDFTTAKPVSQVPALQKLRQAYQESQQQDDLLSFFDIDVLEQIRQAQRENNEYHRQKANGILRVLLSV